MFLFKLQYFTSEIKNNTWFSILENRFVKMRDNLTVKPNFEKYFWRKSWAINIFYVKKSRCSGFNVWLLYPDVITTYSWSKTWIEWPNKNLTIKLEKDETSRFQHPTPKKCFFTCSTYIQIKTIITSLIAQISILQSNITLNIQTMWECQRHVTSSSACQNPHDCH